MPFWREIGCETAAEVDASLRWPTLSRFVHGLGAAEMGMIALQASYTASVNV